MTTSPPSRTRARTRQRTRPLSEGELRQEVAAAAGLSPEAVPGDANLVHLGLGSLEMMRLVTRWRRQGVPADFAELAGSPTLEAWHRHLTAAWAARAPGVE
ncbi:phosphopantetheine-binding protein [Streptomyces chitinivorans]|uniref:Phosphopantetheine-binding protein n=1 Tax=Streptomyces chitinivorans TaxID=1257027 RepID=A0ABW7HLT4_9ACTN|nr:phosphopantetheine-binding protein [Streptomyces chitinivorans]MDH2408978.1 phosphopantetheine-binding protein [Streptomyces chitinivorans]